MSKPAELTRRLLLAGAMATSSLMTARALPPRAPGDRLLVFEVWRNRHLIGHHSVSFQGGDEDFLVSIEATMAVTLGPISLFKYHHQASETWRGGRFAGLRSHTVTNGKTEQVTAIRTPDAVVVKTQVATRTFASATLPLTHWNRHALEGPLFNPQTGAPMREKVSRQDGQVVRTAAGTPSPATRYSLSGDAEIVDWYDPGGAWFALQAKVRDGSSIDYRRLA